LRAGESFTSLGPGQNGADLVYGGPQWERASWPPESRGKISIPCKIPSAGTTRKLFFFKRFRLKDQTKCRVPDACSSERNRPARRRAAQSFGGDLIRFGFENELYVSCVTRLEFTSLRTIKRTRQCCRCTYAAT